MPVFRVFTELLAVSKRLMGSRSPTTSKLRRSLLQGQCQCQLVRLSSSSSGSSSGSDSSSSPIGGRGGGIGGGAADTSGGKGLPPDFNRMGGGGGGSGVSGTMKSWQIHSYGGPSELQLSTGTRIPQITGPEEVLVRVQASSVNPIDLAMTKGYGAEMINMMRDLCPSANLSGVTDLPQKLSNYLLAPVKGKKSVIEFPLTMGRDFAGTVTQVGHGVSSDISVGDEVYGVVGVQRQGSHAEYVVVASDTIKRKPTSLSFVEAASIPYAGITAWSAIKVTGSFWELADKKFLLLGGSGGVGTFAIQYLRSQRATVVTTCSTDAMSLVKSLGANAVIDYKDPECLRQIKELAPYDCILHLSGPENTERAMELTKYLKEISGQFITLSPPFLSNVDKYGLVGGIAKNLSDLVLSNVKTWTDAKAVTKWAFFIPSGEPLKTFADLIQMGHIRPVIQSVYHFDDLPDAYKKLEDGHLRGKIVVEM